MSAITPNIVKARPMHSSHPHSSVLPYSIGRTPALKRPARTIACEEGEQGIDVSSCFKGLPPPRFQLLGIALMGLDLIRFGGRVNYVDLVSWSFVEESLQALGGIRISTRRSLVAAGERPVAI
jgi:hypothetical protein